MNTAIPILVADRRRLAGLAALHDARKDRLAPLFTVPAITGRRDAPPGAPPARTARPEGSPLGTRRAAPDPEARLGAALDAVEEAFGRRRAYLDADRVADRRVADGRLALAWLLDEARTRRLGLVPVTGVGRPDAYQLAVAEAASVDRRGACLRLTVGDLLEGEGVADRAQGVCDLLGLAPERTDVVVDLGRAAAAGSHVLEVAARAVLVPLRRAAPWRRMLLAASGYSARLLAHDRPAEPGAEPDDVRRPANHPRPDRRDWAPWHRVAASGPANFADYRA